MIGWSVELLGFLQALGVGIDIDLWVTISILRNAEAVKGLPKSCAPDIVPETRRYHLAPHLEAQFYASASFLPFDWCLIHTRPAQPASME